MSALEWLAAALMLLGGVFFLSGTVGILRFPDVLTRLHAVTKADNLGLGLICLGLTLAAGSALVGVKLFLIWALALLAASFSCHLIARAMLRERANGSAHAGAADDGLPPERPADGRQGR